MDFPLCLPKCPRPVLVALVHFSVESSWLQVENLVEPELSMQALLLIKFHLNFKINDNKEEVP